MDGVESYGKFYVEVRGGNEAAATAGLSGSRRIGGVFERCKKNLAGQGRPRKYQIIL